MRAIKLSPRNTLILVAVGIVAGLAILAAVLVVPQFKKLSSLDAAIAAADTQVEQAQTLLAARQEAKTNAAMTDAALLELAAGMPETPDQPSLIIELQDYAYDSNVELRTVTPGALTGNGVWITMPMQLMVWGDWADCVDFVQRLQRLTRQVRIIRVDSSLTDVEGAVQEHGQYTNSLTLDINTYIIPSADESGTAAPVAPAPAP